MLDSYSYPFELVGEKCCSHYITNNLVYSYTLHGKILTGKNWQIYELFAKIFLADIHRYTGNVFSALTIAYLPCH